MPLPADLDTRLANSPAPHRILAAALIDGLRQLLPVRDVFDVVVFYLPRRYRNLFELPEENFRLHDNVKGFAATAGLTTQIITDEALGPGGPGSASSPTGVPVTLGPVTPLTAALPSNSTAGQYCCGSLETRGLPR